MKNRLKKVFSILKSNKKIVLSIIIILQLILLLSIAYAYEGTGDNGGWRLAGKTGLYGKQYGMGKGTIYDGDCPLLCSNWPPLTYHYYIAMQWLFENVNLLNFSNYGYFKLLPVFASAGIGFLIYKFSLFFKIKSGFYQLLLFTFHPIVLYVSAYHGQRESVWLFFLIASIYLFYQKKYMLFSLFYAISISIKIPPLLLAPFIFLNIPDKKSKSIFILALPFFFTLLNLPEIFIYTKNVLLSIFLYEGTIGWWGFGAIVSKIDTLFNQSIFSTLFYPFSRIMFFGSIIIYSLYFHKKRYSVLEGVLGIIMVTFVFSSAFAPQYLLWPVPFLVILYKKYKFQFWSYSALGTYAAINSYSSFGITFLEDILRFSQENFYYRLNIPYPMETFFPVWIMCILILLKVIFGSYDNLINKIRKVGPVLVCYTKLNSWKIVILKYLKKVNYNIYVFLSYILVVFLFYQNSLYAFFQGDEWFYFAQFLPLANRWDGIFLTLYKSIFSASEVSSGAHVSPVYIVLWFINNALLGLEYKGYILIGLLTHSINSFLVYSLVNSLKLFKKIAFIAGLIFAATFVHFQAVTWIMAMLNTLFSVTFMLLSLIYLLSANKGSKELYLSASFYVLALLTKETTIILFPILPFIAYLYKREKFLYTLKLIFSISVVYFLFRFGLPIFLSKGEGNTQSIFAIGTDLLLFRSFTYPLKVLVQVFIPSEVILMLAEKMSLLSYPFIESMKTTDMTIYLTLIQGTVSDIIIYFLAGVFLSIIIFVLILLKKSKQSYVFRAVIVSTSIILLSALPLLGIASYAEWWGYTTFIDSRHLYIGTIGASVILAMFIYNLANMIGGKFPKFSFRKTIYLLIFIWMIIQYFLLQNQLIQERKTGLQRKSILHYIHTVVPVLSKNSIFLITSDSHYYGFPNIPPFQTNLGQILAVSYYDKKQLPEQIITQGLFSKAGLLDNGYQQLEGKGFGYFNSEKRVYELIKTLSVNINDLHVFHWDGKNQILSSSSEKFREKAVTFRDIYQSTKNWKNINKGIFAFSYPDSYQVTENINPDGSVYYYIFNEFNYININFNRKPVDMAFHVYAEAMRKELTISGSYQITNLLRTDGTEMTVLKISEYRYLIPLSDSNYFLDVYTEGQFNDSIRMLKYIISTIYF